MQDIIQWVQRYCSQNHSTENFEIGICKIIMSYWWGTNGIMISISGFNTECNLDLAYNIVTQFLGITFINKNYNAVSGKYFKCINNALVIQNATVRRLLCNRCVAVDICKKHIQIQITNTPITQQIRICITGFPVNIKCNALLAILSCDFGLHILKIKCNWHHSYISTERRGNYFFDSQIVREICIVCIHDYVAAKVIRQKRYKWIEIGLDQKVFEWFMEFHEIV